MAVREEVCSGLDDLERQRLESLHKRIKEWKEAVEPGVKWRKEEAVLSDLARLAEFVARKRVICSPSSPIVVSGCGCPSSSTDPLLRLLAKKVVIEK